MLAAFLMTSFFSGLGHDNTILTGQGAQVFLLLLLKGSDKWMKVELTAFHWRLYSFFLTNRFSSWRHLWNTNSPTLDRPRRAVLQRNYLSQLLTPLQQVLQAPLQAAANVHTTTTHSGAKKCSVFIRKSTLFFGIDRHTRYLWRSVRRNTQHYM